MAVDDRRDAARSLRQPPADTSIMATTRNCTNGKGTSCKTLCGGAAWRGAAALREERGTRGTSRKGSSEGLKGDKRWLRLRRGGAPRRHRGALRRVLRGPRGSVAKQDRALVNMSSRGNRRAEQQGADWSHATGHSRPREGDRCQEQSGRNCFRHWSMRA